MVEHCAPCQNHSLVPRYKLLHERIELHVLGLGPSPIRVFSSLELPTVGTLARKKKKKKNDRPAIVQAAGENLSQFRKKTMHEDQDSRIKDCLQSTPFLVPRPRWPRDSHGFEDENARRLTLY